MKKRVDSIVLAVMMVATMLTGCGGSDKTASNKDGQVTLKVFSNLPDRKNGQGLVEQTIIDEYMEENPDVVSIWGQPSFLDEVLDAGVLAELDESDYADYGFVEGSLDGFKKDGKLYGLPRNTDVAAFYYNQKMFEDNGWEVPTTYDELLALAPKITSAGMVPVAMDGGDGWPMAIYLSDLLFKLTGSDYSDVVSNAIKTGDFSDPNLQKATQLMKDAADAGLFQKGYDSQDYGTAQNLFTNGQAAMYYMGSWDASMALNEDIPEEVRTNIRMFTMPTVEGGKGGAYDIAAWNGGGYAVSAQSEVKDEAVKFLNYMYQ